MEIFAKSSLSGLIEAGGYEDKYREAMRSINKQAVKHKKKIEVLAAKHQQDMQALKREMHALKNRIGNPLAENIALSARVKEQDAALQKLRLQFEVVVQQLNEAKAKLRESEMAYA